MAYDYDLICIGSGPAGQRAAVQAAKLGKKVAVIEKKNTVGGVCVDTGTIPSKTFREAVLSTIRPGLTNGGGTQTRQRPSVEQLLSRVEQVVAKEGAVIANQLARNGVDVFCGVASFADPHRVRVDMGAGGWREVTGANILVATGTKASIPPEVARDHDVVITSDDIARITRLPRSLAVVGAGVIGIEYASMFAALGVEVTVIDKRERPLEFLDTEIVDELIHQMRNRNVYFRFGEAVKSLEVDRSQQQPRAVIHLESEKRIIAEMALFSVGRTGATDSLHLEKAGITTDDRGRIVVDKSFRTSVPHIYAAGDVIGYPSLAATSSEQGRLAACFALGAPAGPMTTYFPIGIYSVPEISMVGAPEHELTKKQVPYEVGIARYREIARGQILGDDSGFFKMLFDRGDKRLLGVHIIGTGATELLHIGQAVIGLNGTLDYFLSTVFNYPTLAECYKVAALNAANKLAM